VNAAPITQNLEPGAIKSVQDRRDLSGMACEFMRAIFVSGLQTNDMAF
jgi:hypothetical protein